MCHLVLFLLRLINPHAPSSCFDVVCNVNVKQVPKKKKNLGHFFLFFRFGKKKERNENDPISKMEKGKVFEGPAAEYGADMATL